MLVSIYFQLFIIEMEIKNPNFDNKELSLIYQARNYKKLNLADDINITLEIINLFLKINYIYLKKIDIKKIKFLNLNNENNLINYCKLLRYIYF